MKFEIREGVKSVWHYHLAEDGVPLCGHAFAGDTMLTQLPVSTWGMKTHLHETYCKKCDKIISKRGLLLKKMDGV